MGQRLVSQQYDLFLFAIPFILFDSHVNYRTNVLKYLRLSQLAGTEFTEPFAELFARHR